MRENESEYPKEKGIRSYGSRAYTFARCRPGSLPTCVWLSYVAYLQRDECRLHDGVRCEDSVAVNDLRRAAWLS